MIGLDGENCPFCARIEAGEYFRDFAGSVVRFEPLNPITPGHMLFVPDAHHEHPDIRAVSWCMREAEDWGSEQGEDFNLITSSGENATQSVAHIHIHYVPRREGDGLHLPWTGQEKKE